MLLLLHDIFLGGILCESSNLLHMLRSVANLHTITSRQNLTMNSNLLYLLLKLLATLYHQRSLNLCSFPFYNFTTLIDDLKSELPMYLAAAEDVSSQTDPFVWWKSHETQLPIWSKAFRLVVLVQPSSAASERVFSILSNSFSTRQESSLEDYIQLSVMLQYNNRSC